MVTDRYRLVMQNVDLLVLLHGAVDRTTTLTGELRTWQHGSRSQRAFEVARPVGGTMVHYRGGSDEAQESEAVWRVVQGAGGRYRWDQVSQSGAAVHVGRPGTQGCDGQRAWFVGPDTVHVHPAHGNALHRLLDPSWVLTHDLDIVGDGESSGRAVALVRATARSSRPRSGGASDMAAERDLVVDAERGFLHSDTGLVDGEPYDLMELRDVVLDPQIDPATFNPEIPPGMRVDDHMGDPVRRPWERQRRWHFQWPLSRW